MPSWLKKLRTAAVAVLVGVVIICIIVQLAPPMPQWSWPWSSGSTLAPTGRVTTATHLTAGCDQTLSDPFPLGSAPIPVTDGTICYALLNVLSGEVRVEGPGGYIDVGPYGIIGQHTAPGWRAVSMYALKSAIIQKRLCPPDTTGWNGQQCV